MFRGFFLYKLPEVDKSTFEIVQMCKGRAQKTGNQLLNTKAINSTRNSKN